MDGPEPIWTRAASFAARAHQGQTRHDGATPYFAHCARVAMTVRDEFGCEDGVCLAAALLHDTIEDTPTDYDDIAEGFGGAVAQCVAALTKNMLLPESEREEDYDRRLAEADWRARLVKLADTLDNLRTIADSTPAQGERLVERCRRAIALARGDADERPETATAIGLIESSLPATRV